METEAPKRKFPASRWLKRSGIAGFPFFFVKGLIRLVVFIAAAYFGYDFLN